MRAIFLKASFGWAIEFVPITYFSKVMPFNARHLDPVGSSSSAGNPSVVCDVSDGIPSVFSLLHEASYRKLDNCFNSECNNQPRQQTAFSRTAVLLLSVRRPDDSQTSICSSLYWLILMEILRNYCKKRATNVSRSLQRLLISRSWQRLLILLIISTIQSVELTADVFV